MSDKEHDFDHVEFVQCMKCGKKLDCHEYYERDKPSEYYGECRGKKNE